MDVSGSASVLNDLTDVSITTPSNGHLLRYRTSQWVNEAFPSIPSSLDDLSNVSASSKTNGDVLVRINDVYESNVFQPAILAVNTTSQAWNSVASTGTTGVFVTNSSADGNVTNSGDITQDLLSTNYFQNYNNGTSEVVGPYEIIYYVEANHTASGVGTLYLVEIDTGVRTNLETLHSTNVNVSGTQYYNGAITLVPVTGREYSIAYATTANANLVQFRLLWRKLGQTTS